MEVNSVPGTPPTGRQRPPNPFADEVDIFESPPTQRGCLRATSRTRQQGTSVKPLQLSKESLNYMGLRIPENTKRQEQYSLRALSRFVTEYLGFVEEAFKTVEHLRSYIMDDSERKLRWQLEQTRTQVLSGLENVEFLPPGYADWNLEQLKRVRHYLIEFVVNYRSSKTNVEVKPSSMKTYILGLQRAFATIWGYKLKILEGPTFNCSNEGLLAVIDNRFSLQQANGIFTESHNVLSHEDLEKLYRSPDLGRDKPKSFLARLVFDIALVTALRPSALVHLTTSQFSKLKLRGEMVWRIRQAVGSRCGSSKTNAGGWKFAGEKLVETFVWNRPALGGILNVYDDIDDYMSVRMHMAVGSDRFFLGCKANGVTMSTFFKNQHLGRNSFSRIVKDVCASNGILGTGSKRGMITHGLRGTVTTLLVEAGHSDSAIALRSGHRDPKSLKNYQNLQGSEGERQQCDILHGVTNASKRSGVHTTIAEKHKVKRRNTKKNDENVISSYQLSDCRNLEEESTENYVDTGSRSAKLLSDVNNISGGNFSITVNHHYR